jgi:hypothetical protein
MKKILSILVGLMLFAAIAIAGPAGPFPNKEFGQDLGKAGRSYGDLYMKNTIYFEGATSDAYETKFFVTDPTADRTITFQNGTGTVAFTSDVSTAAPAINAVTAAAADATIAFTAYQFTGTSTLTNKDMFTFQGLGAFGDVSVMRIEQKTGNATDGTVLEVVSADANVDPLVVSSSAQAGVLTVGQGGTVDIIGATGITGATTITGLTTITGAATVSSTFQVAGATTLSSTLAVNGNATIGNNSGTVAVNSSDWDISTTGAMTGIASIAFDDSSVIYSATVACNNACIKALRAAPKELVAAPGADKFVELVSATLILNYGSEVLTESADDLVIQYNTSGTDITASIDSTSFMDSNADTIKIVQPSAVVLVTAANSVNKAVELFNTGDGELAGNATNDTTMSIRVLYRVHTAGL